MSKAAGKAAQQKNVIVKLLVGAGQASPSPPVGPALGSKGVKSMDFCKVYNFFTNALVYHDLTLLSGVQCPDRSLQSWYTNSGSRNRPSRPILYL